MVKIRLSEVPFTVALTLANAFMSALRALVLCKPHNIPTVSVL